MRHGKKDNHLGRTSAHRKALLSNMASSLILHKRITTTVAKAKELRKFVEPLITKSKVDSTHSRRTVFSYLQNKESVKTLFDDVANKIASRPGGYTRIIRTGNRLGDNAETCIMELVDYNEVYNPNESKGTAKKTRRSRRGGSSSGASSATVKTEKQNSSSEETIKKEVIENKVETADQSETKKVRTASVEDKVLEPQPQVKKESSNEKSKSEDSPGKE